MVTVASLWVFFLVSVEGHCSQPLGVFVVGVEGTVASLWVFLLLVLKVTVASLWVCLLVLKGL